MARLLIYENKKSKQHLWNMAFTKTETYFNIPNDDTLPICIQEVVAFGVTTDHFRNSPLHLWETSEYKF